MSRLITLLVAALVAAPAAGAAAQTGAPVDTTSRAGREASREAARERRDRERERARDRAQARRDSINAEREARDDLGLSELGAVVREGVRAGMRGAAEGIRAAREALREVDAELADEEDRRAGGARAETTRLDTTVSVGREPTVDLSLVSGPVTVTAWDRAEVRVRGQSDRLPLRFESTGGAVRVYSPRSRGRGGDQRLEVMVPAGARLTAASVSGDVRVRGVRGDLDARSVSGDVDVEGTGRRAALTSVSGDVRGAGFEGDVRVESVSGDVSLDNVGGQVDAKTTSGGVTVRRARLTRLRAETVSGDVRYDGTLARDGRYDLSSHSGEIHLALPPNASAALSVRTYSGAIDTDVPLTLQPNGSGAARNTGRRLEFTLGGGGARVTAESFSGDITIARPGSSTAPR
jgi:hypothetical protein